MTSRYPDQFLGSLVSNTELKFTKYVPEQYSSVKIRNRGKKKVEKMVYVLCVPIQFYAKRNCNYIA